MVSTSIQLDDIWAERILSSVAGLEYGSVQIIVHDSKIVQIERTERKRFDTPSANPRPRPNKTAGQSPANENGQVAHWKKRKS